MKKTACIFLLLIMIILLANPLPADARGSGRRGGHHGSHWGTYHGSSWSGHGVSHWRAYRGRWAPRAAFGAAALWPFYYGSFSYGRYYGPYCGPYYDPYCTAPPPVVAEQPPVDAQPLPSAPPAGIQVGTDKLFIYPRQGQDEKQQATDRYECHRWAVNESGFDPSIPAGILTESPQAQKEADYRRAVTACLDGRGYTVK